MKEVFLLLWWCVVVVTVAYTPKQTTEDRTYMVVSQVQESCGSIMFNVSVKTQMIAPKTDYQIEIYLDGRPGFALSSINEARFCEVVSVARVRGFRKQGNIAVAGGSVWTGVRVMLNRVTPTGALIATIDRSETRYVVIGDGPGAGLVDMWAEILPNSDLVRTYTWSMNAAANTLTAECISSPAPDNTKLLQRATPARTGCDATPNRIIGYLIGPECVQDWYLDVTSCVPHCVQQLRVHSSGSINAAAAAKAGTRFALNIVPK